MKRYYYSIVRCLPNPRTGEFVNVGAIAGDPGTDDWAVRGLSNEQRARKFAGADDLSVANDFITRLGYEIDFNSTSLDSGEGEPLELKWLEDLYQSHRNIVQLSAPNVIGAESAESALDSLFGRLILEPESTTQTRVTKHRVISALKRAYQGAEIRGDNIRQRVDFFVGDYVTSKLDFAIGNGRAVQLSQGWSFQVGGLSDVSTQVKSWAYALTRLQDGDEGRIVDSRGAISIVEPRVDIEVVVVEPETADQARVFREAQQIFRNLGVEVKSMDEVGQIGARARELLGAEQH